MTDERVFGLLGFASRARQLTSGEFDVARQINKGCVAAVLLDETVSDNTRKRFFDACTNKKIPLFEHIPKDRLARAIGNQNRKIVALKKGKLAEQIIKLLTPDLSIDEVK